MAAFVIVLFKAIYAVCPLWWTFQDKMEFAELIFFTVTVFVAYIIFIQRWKFQILLKCCKTLNKGFLKSVFQTPIHNNF